MQLPFPFPFHVNRCVSLVPSFLPSFLPSFPSTDRPTGRKKLRLTDLESLASRVKGDVAVIETSARKVQQLADSCRETSAALAEKKEMLATRIDSLKQVWQRLER